MQPVFRFAPSPNGRLHLGHAYSALLNQKMAREAGGRLLLRIEDTDQQRCTPELRQHVIDDLLWLGLRWQAPVRVQSEHFELYEAALSTLWMQDCVYPCFCSRRQSAAAAVGDLDPEGQPLYNSQCRDLDRAFASRRISRGEQHGWQLKTKDTDAAVWGDVMIAKRHVGSFYHIAVVVDDALQGVTHVVRGQDLEAATSIHLLLQKRLGLPSPRHLHHKLLLDDAGEKLSKRRQSRSLASLREDGVTPREVRQSLGF